MSVLRLSTACAVFVLAGLVPRAAAADWKKDLETALETRWTPAKLTFLGDNIRQPGTVLLLMQPGVLADRNSAPVNDVRAGMLMPQSRSNQFGALLREAQDSEALQHRVMLRQYQPVFLTGVRVLADRIVIDVATRGQFLHESVDRAAIARFVEGTSLKSDRLSRTDASIRKAALVFHFRGFGLEQQPLDAVTKMIEQLLLPADHPDAPQFGTVAVGMTRAQVVRNLGKPQNVVKLEDREILVFDKIKVTLRDDKVVDVQ